MAKKTKSVDKALDRAFAKLEHEKQAAAFAFVRFLYDMLDKHPKGEKAKKIIEQAAELTRA